jgi:hypothetical protein
MLLYVFQKRCAPGMADQEQSRRQDARLTTRRILPFRCPQRLARAVRQLPKSARFGRFVGSALIRAVGDVAECLRPRRWQAIEAFQSLPDGATFDDPIERLCLIAKIEEGLRRRRPSYQFSLNTSCPSRPPGSNVLFGSR